MSIDRPTDRGRAGRDGCTLDALAPGESGVVVRLGGDPAIARRLMELGITPGTTIEVVRRAPLGDPVELRLRDIHLSIRRSEASRIHVEPC